MADPDESAVRRAGGRSAGFGGAVGGCRAAGGRFLVGDVAAALLGDPSVLNGLDPQGILWIRKFEQGLAAEGRTVLVSSHLLSKMAEDLVVIGQAG